MSKEGISISHLWWRLDVEISKVLCKFKVGFPWFITLSKYGCVWVLILKILVHHMLPWWLRWERIHLKYGRSGFDPWFGKISWRGEWLSTPEFWPGEFYGLCRPGGHKESDMTERLSLTHIINCLKWLLISPPPLLLFPSSSFFPLCPFPFHCSSLCHVFHSLLSSEDTIGNKTLSKMR